MPPDPATLITQLTDAIHATPGVVAVVLGGSRATETHVPESDIDLGIYYADAATFDLEGLRQVAATFEDAKRADILTDIGSWGPWINGGGWLTVQGRPVDFLYRDLTKVAFHVEQVRRGQYEKHYQWGHPHVWATTIYAAEVAACRVLWERDDAISQLKARLTPYPPALRAALIRDFAGEAAFMSFVAKHGLPRGDVSYTAGCCFRAVACLMQALFALNGAWLLNEKGAVARAATMPITVPSLTARVNGMYAAIGAGELAAAVNQLDDLILAIQGLYP